ncbi:MAG: M23 family metallopeptidase [Gallionellaceae bacterium]
MVTCSKLVTATSIVTRYGPASKLLVKVGQMIRAGQEIAEVGSSGRSTGGHMHFEARYKGIAQNPRRFLESAAG